MIEHSHYFLLVRACFSAWCALAPVALVVFCWWCEEMR